MIPAVLPVEAIREIDRLAIEEYGMQGLVLMENAGGAVARHLIDSLPAASAVTILCGAGNNGGDGLVIARHLDYFGWNVRVWMLGKLERLSSDCEANWRILERSAIPKRVWSSASSSEEDLHTDLTESTVVIDAMLGTGQTGPPLAPFATAISLANAFPGTRIAIDVPTGLDASSGMPLKPTFVADRTYTFVAAKPGFRSEQSHPWLGEVHVISIGVPRQLVQRVFSTCRGPL